MYSINKDDCRTLDLCFEACPVSAIEMAFTVNNGSFTESFSIIDQSKCISCGMCKNVCYVDAIKHSSENPDDPFEPYDPFIYMGGDSSGGSGSSPNEPWSNNYNDFKNKALDVLNKYNTSKFKNIVDNIGLADDIRALNMEKIAYLTKQVGGDVKQIRNFAKNSPLGKIAMVGTVFDGIDTVVAFTDGEITTDDWIQAGTFMVGVATFIPGPIGIVATGINIGIAVYNSKKK